MVLSSRDRTRYARQLLLPQLGEAGQLRLLASTVSVHAARTQPSTDSLDQDVDVEALDVATRYLERAGVRVIDRSAEPSVPETTSLHGFTRAQVDTIAGGPALREAACALAGALAAVAAIQTLAGLTQHASELQIIAISSEEA